MKKIQDLPIKFKILSIVFGGLISIFTIQFLNISSAHQNQETLQNMRDKHFPVLEILDRNIVTLDKIKETYLSSVITSDEDLVEDAQTLIQVFQKSLLQITPIRPAYKSELELIIKHSKNYQTIADQVSLGIIEEELSRSKITALSKEMKSKLSILETDLKELRKSSYQTFISAIDSAKEFSKEAVTGGIIVGILAFVFLILIGLVVSTSILRNIQGVDASLKFLSSGDGDLSVRLTSSSNDEVGQLVNSFNIFIEKLHGVIGGVINLAHYVSEESNNLKQRSQKSLIGMNSQTDEIGKIVLSIAKLSNQVHMISENANNAATVSHDILSKAEDGQNVVEENLEIIGILSSEIEDATKVIQKLEIHSTSIGKVLNVIQEIAEQTNLLALNAAIEAARAGDMGRGFAVVADEVRLLANRTQDATLEINEMINGLQSGTTNAVQLINQGNDQAKKSVTHAKKVKQTLIEVSSDIKRISTMSEEIADATSAQNTVTHEINNNVINLGQVATQVSEDSTSALENSKTVAELSVQLNKIVSIFKLQ